MTDSEWHLLCSSSCQSAESGMLRSSNELKDFAIAATDGDVGQVEAFCFDDKEWTVRYFLVNTGGWLHARKVLISPLSIGTVDWIGRGIVTDLTRAEVRASPRIDMQKALLRQHEVAYNDHFSFPHYWTAPNLWRPAKLPSEVNKRGGGEARPGSVTSHVHSTKELVGFSLAASDGEIGHVDDFIIDDETWTIRYLVVDTRNWWPGKKVMISPHWISTVNWQKRKVNIDLSRNEIRKSPEYDDTSTIDRDYEERLYEHYGQSGYRHG
jgi:uncharacterized protein YrrD